MDLRAYDTGSLKENAEPVTITLTLSDQDHLAWAFRHELRSEWLSWYERRLSHSPSRAHAAEILALTRNWLLSVYSQTEGLAKPYDEAFVLDQFDYESVIRPATHTYRGRLRLRGRAQPLAIDDDD